MKRIKFDAEPSERIADGYWVVNGRVDTSNGAFDKLYLGDRVEFDEKAFGVMQLNERNGGFIDVEIQRKHHLEILSNSRNNTVIREEGCKKKIAQFKSTVALKREEFDKAKKAAADLYSNPIGGIEL